MRLKTNDIALRVRKAIATQARIEQRANAHVEDLKQLGLDIAQEYAKHTSLGARLKFIKEQVAEPISKSKKYDCELIYIPENYGKKDAQGRTKPVFKFKSSGAMSYFRNRVCMIKGQPFGTGSGSVSNKVESKLPAEAQRELDKLLSKYPFPKSDWTSYINKNYV
jgi:hypothetical protein